MPTANSLQQEVFLLLFGIVATLLFMNVLFAGFCAKVYYLFEEIESLLFMGSTIEILEIESLMSKERKSEFWGSLQFDKQVPFSLGDTGLVGGIETTGIVYHHITLSSCPERGPSLV